MFQKIISMLLGAATVQNSGNLQTVEQKNNSSIVHEEVALVTSKEEGMFKKNASHQSDLDQKLNLEMEQAKSGLDSCQHCPLHCHGKSKFQLDKFVEKCKHMMKQTHTNTKEITCRLHKHLQKAKTHSKTFFQQIKEKIQKKHKPEEQP